MDFFRLFLQIWPSPDPSNGLFNALSSTYLLRTQGSRFPVQWQYCQISMDFFQFYQNSTTYTDVTVIRPLKCQINPLSPTCSLRTQGPWFPVQWQYCQFSMDFFQFHKKKLDHLYRCYRHPTPKMPKLTLCLPPARWEPRALDSKCSGNIARFRRISSKLDYLYKFSRNRTPTMSVLTLWFPRARWGPRAFDF